MEIFRKHLKILPLIPAWFFYCSTFCLQLANELQRTWELNKGVCRPLQSSLTMSRLMTALITSTQEVVWFCLFLRKWTQEFLIFQEMLITRQEIDDSIFLWCSVFRDLKNQTKNPLPFQRSRSTRLWSWRHPPAEVPSCRKFLPVCPIRRPSTWPNLQAEFKNISF